MRSEIMGFLGWSFECVLPEKFYESCAAVLELRSVFWCYHNHMFSISFLKMRSSSLNSFLLYMRLIKYARIAIAIRRIILKPSFFSSVVLLSTWNVAVSSISPMGLNVARVLIVYSPDWI